MREMSPAEKLVELLGSNADVARKFKITREAVRQWMERGIPEDRALDVEELTRGCISAYDILKHRKKLRAAA